MPACTHTGEYCALGNIGQIEGRGVNVALLMGVLYVHQATLTFLTENSRRLSNSVG